jgi:Fungal specific transcription factor domain
MGDTDPGLRYYNHHNVQCSTARMSNANMIAYVDILSLVVYPLDPKETEHCHPWLLQDNARNIRRIYGGTGLSPKLLHILGQITHLCARFTKVDEQSQMLPLGAQMIDNKLLNFRQWSELSEGYANVQELLDSIVLGDDKLVNTNVKVTELSGEAWVQACRLYLHCRFFR